MSVVRPAPRSHRARVAPSVREAREVVGMYGDPATTWGICLEIRLTESEDVRDVAERIGTLCTRYPHLGSAPVVTRHDDVTWADARQAIATAPYGPASSLLRLALTADGTGLLVGAHHGAVDGLGLLAVAGAASGRELSTRARGIGDRAAPHGFVVSSLSRLGEAVIGPPDRFSGTGELTSTAEDLTAVSRPRVDRGTADLARVLLDLHAEGAARPRRRPVVVIGASRRTVDVPLPDRQTAYLRLRMRPGVDRTDLTRLIAGLRPEPDFPETSARGVAPLAVKLLRNRLGATAMVSNLGLVQGDGVATVAMYPASSGPRSVAVGLASSATTTTVSLRTRRCEFDAEDHARLLAGIVDRFFD